MQAKRLGYFFLDIIQIVFFAVAIFLFTYLLVLQPHKIKGESMTPNFQNGQFLLTEKVSYRFGFPQRGDVVVFKAPPDYREEFIKRIIGLPGEKVLLRNGHFYINGQQLTEEYISPTVLTQPGGFLQEGREVTVPENSLFVVGDNRGGSHDSRNFGFITRDKITGKAWVSYWPPQLAGAVPKPQY